MHKNIVIAYFLTLCKHSWFWLGVWVFYYLRFTDYAGIGLIETVMILTMTLTEIPTGALADLIGKRRTLMAAFLLEAGGAWWYALTNNYWGLVGAVFIMCVGGAFYSGTLEALVYDTLKDQSKEKSYDQVLANIQTIYLAAVAVFGLIGGFLFTLHFRLPFILNAVFYTLGLAAAFWLAEPKSDSEKFSLAAYLSQTRQGYRQLTASITVRRRTILLLMIGFVAVILDEMLNSFLGVEFGLSETMMGVFWAAIFVATAAASQFTPWLRRKWGSINATILVGLILAISLMVSPLAGLVLGMGAILINSIAQAFYGNLASVMINQQTESRYRATTLSTFNMVKNIPYVMTAYGLGVLADVFSAKYTAAVLGIALLIGLIGWKISDRHTAHQLIER